MVIELAKPYDEEEAKRMLQRAQYVPRPQAVQQQKDPLIEVAQAAGADVAGKVGSSVGTKLGKMALGKGTELMAGLNTAGAPLGAMLPGGATAGATGLMSGLAPMAMTALPMLAGAAVLGKVFKLFNHGGLVGPLGNMSKVKYKESGGDVTQEYEVNMGPLSKGV